MPPRFRIALLGLAGCLVLLSVGHAADPQPYRVELASTGQDELDSTLAATSQLEALRASAPVGPYGLIARARADIDRLVTVLQSFGYYDGSVAITIDGLALDDAGLGEALSARPSDKDAQVRITLRLGPLFRLGRIETVGAVPPTLRGALGLSPGDPAVADRVFAGGARLQTALQDGGYAFAKVAPPIAREVPAAHTLNLEFRVDAGPRVAVGAIRFEGLKHVRESFVRGRLRLRTGEPYDASQVERARNELLAAGVFASVSVRLDRDPAAPGRVSITFVLRERPRYTFGLSAAYSSDLGVSGGLNWSDRDLLGGAQRLELSASLINLGGTATTGVGYESSIKYILPDFLSRDQSLQFAVGALRQPLQAYDQVAETAGATLSRRFSSVWTATAGVTAETETITQYVGPLPSPPESTAAPAPVCPSITSSTPETTANCQSVRSAYTLLALPLGLLYDTTDLPSPLEDPTHGFRGSVNASPTLSLSTSSTLSNAAFLIVQGTLAHYIDLGRLFGAEPGRSVIAVRGTAGEAVGVSSFGQLPADQRFYAGGSGTVRGFRYQSVGPEFITGDPIGGTSIAAASIELRQRFDRNFGFTVFVDGGEVSEPSTSSSLDNANLKYGDLELTPSELASTFRIGAGAGLLYYTPIGPVRLQFGLPLNPRANDDRFEVYIGLGQAF
ncbi:MAG TPA: BamA/TamA family outer membrane protein [Steroidobacteraceae bacterium]|nr:BamA/TamA family outer membrane protein [Steroidobacteraceae bacterium]